RSFATFSHQGPAGIFLARTGMRFRPPVLLQERRHHVQKRSMPFVFLIVTCLAGGLLATGCTSNGGGGRRTRDSGSVQIALQVGGATVNSVSYTITGPASFTQSGTIDV